MDWKVKVAKRVMDVVGASAALVVTGPFFPVLAAAIYLDNPGPVFFAQERVGLTDATGSGADVVRVSLKRIGGPRKERR